MLVPLRGLVLVTMRLDVIGGLVLLTVRLDVIGRIVLLAAPRLGILAGLGAGVSSGMVLLLFGRLLP